jgi:hypothetical protein
LLKTIAQADRTAEHGRYYDWRLVARERARVLRMVLVELERAGVDFAKRWRRK